MMSSAMPLFRLSPAISALLLLLQMCVVTAFDYRLTAAGKIYLVDTATNISHIESLFRGSRTTVHVDQLEWTGYDLFTNKGGTNSVTTTLFYDTFINGQVAARGSVDLSEPGTLPPKQIAVGTIQVDQGGRQNISVALQVLQKVVSNKSEGESDTTSTDAYTTSPTVETYSVYSSYPAWISILPILLLSGFSLMTGQVEISLTLSILMVAITVTGGFFQGTKRLLEVYILNALTTTENGYIMLFVFFFSGITAIVEKSGGMLGWIQWVARRVSTTRAAQIIGFVLGVGFLFYDDILSVMVVGALMRPLMDVAHSSRPLVAWMVDATATSIASLVPLSSWVSWEVRLIQRELDRLQENSFASGGGGGSEELAISTDAVTVLLNSLPYCFYPVFLLSLVPLLMWTQRHMGPMLVAERYTQVYQRDDGGDVRIQGPGPHYPNIPSLATECRPWNAWIPFGLVVVLFWIMFVQTGVVLGGDNVNSIMDIFVYANGLSALLQAVALSFFLTIFTMAMQLQHNEKVFFLPFNIVKLIRQRKSPVQNDSIEPRDRLSKARKQTEKVLLQSESQLPAEEESINVEQQEEQSETEDASSVEDAYEVLLATGTDRIGPLIPVRVVVQSFFFGFGRVMPFIIQLMLAWAIGHAMRDVGTDRWIASILVDNPSDADVRWLPTMAFAVSFILSFATGLTRGTTASIILPLVVGPAYELSQGDSALVYSVFGSVFSGCVAGDHGSPISTSTLLASLSSDCHLVWHVTTQLPYVLLIASLSVLVGTFPIGFSAYPNYVGFILGAIMVVAFVVFVCQPVLDPSGKWDIFTSGYMRLNRLLRRTTKNDDSVDNAEKENESDDICASRDIYNDKWAKLTNDTIDVSYAMLKNLANGVESNESFRSLVAYSTNNGSKHEEVLPDTSEESSDDAESGVSDPTVRPVLIVATDESGKEKQVFNKEQTQD